MLLEVTMAGAFFGGTLALLSPCSALLLPAFFAYAFKSKKELATHTLLFLAGLSTLFIPLGMGASWAGSLILDYRTTSIWIVGLLLIVFGVIEISGLGFSLLPQRFSQRTMDGSWTSAYVTGLVYGFAGFCSGPLLGAVLTMAAGAANASQGALLLLMYACGMAFPLFILALLWDRYKLGSKRWLRGREIRIGPFQLHSTRVITGGLFIALGVLFILSGGSVAFEQWYASLGLIDLSMKLQHELGSWTSNVPNGVWFALLGIVGILVLWKRQRRKF